MQPLETLRPSFPPQAFHSAVLEPADEAEAESHSAVWRAGKSLSFIIFVG